MRTITVSPEENTLGALLKQAMQESLILQTVDGHEFILAEIDDFDREITLTRQNEELMRLLDERGQEKATISLAEARARLAAKLETRVNRSDDSLSSKEVVPNATNSLG
jgi:hypothetical protein